MTEGGLVRPRGLGRGLGALIPPAASQRSATSAAPVAAEPEPAAPSEAVRALDRWLWRAGEAELPTIPAAAGESPVDVPRGTSVGSLTPLPVPDADRPGSGDHGPDSSDGGSRGAEHGDRPDPQGADPEDLNRGSENTGTDDAADDGAVGSVPADAVGELGDADGPDPSPHVRLRDADVTLVPSGGAVYAELDPARIRPNPRQPRQVFDPESINELAASIREVGLLQPVVVRAVGAGDYELVVGERRWRASQEAGLERVPAIVKPTGDDVMLRDALLENIQRVQLNPLEEAAAYGQLLEDFGCTQDELATRLGRSRPQVTNTLRLLRLSPPVQRRVAAGVLSAGHAKALLGLADPVVQDVLASRIVAEGLSVRSVEELVSTGAAVGRGRLRAPGRSAPPTANDGSAVADRLSGRLDTRVTVIRSRSRGRLVVEFATDSDLARIADLIDPPGPTGGQPERTGLLEIQDSESTALD